MIERGKKRKKIRWYGSGTKKAGEWNEKNLIENGPEVVAHLRTCPRTRRLSNYLCFFSAAFFRAATN